MRAMEQNYNGYASVPQPKVSRKVKNAVTFALDFLIVIAAYTVAFWGRAVITPLDYFNSLPFVVASGLIILLSLYLFGVYQRIWQRTSGHGISVIINAVGAATLVQVLVSVGLEQRPLPLSVIVIGNTMALGGFVAIRYRSRMVDGMSWRWRAVWNHEFPQTATRVLVIGAGNSGQTLAWRLKHRAPNDDKKFKIIGFVDDDPFKQNMYVEGSPILGTRQEIPALAEKYEIDLIIVAIHNISGPDFREILAFCEKTNVMIKVVPDVFELVNARKNVSLLRDVQPEDLIGRSTLERHRAVDMTPVMNKVVLVTGAAGSIGSELSRQIVDYDPVQVILLDSNESGLHDLYIEVASKMPEAKRDILVQALVDVTDRAALEDLYARYQPQVVFHAAAYKHVPVLQQYPEQALRVNVGGTRNLVELAVKNNVERFVLVSTDKAVKPSNVMGATKRICELLLGAYAAKDTNTMFTSVRFGNVLGSRGSVVPTFNRQIESGGPVTVTHPEMTRYFMSIPEAVNLVIHAACLTKGSDIFLLKMGEVVRITDLAERMIRLRGLRPNIDIPIHYTGIRPGEKLHEELYTDADNAQETAHPDIIQLDSPYYDLVPDVLLDNVDNILTQGIKDKDAALDTLRKIIAGEPHSYILANAVNNQN